MDRATAARIASARAGKATKLACVIVQAGYDADTLEPILSDTDSEHAKRLRTQTEKIAGTREASAETWAVVFDMVRSIERSRAELTASLLLRLERTDDPT